MLSDRILSAGPIAALVTISATGLILLVWQARRTRASTDSNDDDVAWKIVRNSSVPIISQFFIRGIDLAVALFVLRLLGPSGNGQYALAVIVWFYAKTISDFGLGLYTTREISKNPQTAGLLTGGTALFRLLALGIAAVPAASYLGLRLTAGSLDANVVVAAGILLTTIIPGSLSEAINAAINGVERMELAAGINAAVSIFRGPLAVLAAASTLGIVGIAIVALASSLVSAAAFSVVYRRLDLPTMSFRLARLDVRLYARESAPLLVNSLLVSLFFRFDVFIIEAFKGAEEIGLYDAAFKPINLLTIIPAYATLAVFPLLSRRADDLVNLRRASDMTGYLLVTLAWIIVVVTFALATPMIRLLAGNGFLPDSALLLRILIFFAPLSFLNGVFQYVLIARGQQRQIVPAFAAAVIFNVAGNLLLAPLYGAIAAAVLTVATEVVIFVAFVIVSRDSPVRIHEPAALTRLFRPTVAGVSAAVAVLLLRSEPALALIVGIAVLAVVGQIAGVVGDDEREIGVRVIRRFTRTVESA